MNIIGTIIMIVIAIGIIEAVLEKVGELAGTILKIVAGILLLVGGFYVLKILLKVVIKVLHFLICLIPKWFIYGYSIIFSVFCLLVIAGIVFCALTVQAKRMFEDELDRVSMIGTREEIVTAIQHNVETNTFGLLRIVVEKMIKSGEYESIVAYNCTRLSLGCCTRRFFVELTEELDQVIAELGMATDREIMDELGNRQEEISETLYRIKELLRDLKQCCGELKMRGKLEVIDLKFENMEGIPYIEQKLYHSTHSCPNPENMLPSQTFHID